MTPLDRAALADALASATADDLREDAEVCRSALAYAGNDRTAASLQRLAALALAVAAMQERNVSEVSKTGANVWLWGGGEFSEKFPSIAAALAALLKGDQ